MSGKLKIPKIKKLNKKEVEEIKVAGGKVVETVKNILREGNIRRLYIKHKGKTIIEIPFTMAAIGIFLAPILAAVGAIAALVSECTIGVEHKE